jgi:predicted CXXCH cytochrome family protein
MDDSRRPTRWAFWLLGAGVTAGAVWAAWPRARPGPTPPAEEAFPLPPYTASPYLNVGPEAHYIGTAACAECHKTNHKSYLHTAHSRAFSDVNAADEPPDGSFEHKTSGRVYRAYRKDGQLRHQELWCAEDGKEMARVDLPVRYLVGSGSYARTYLVEVDGFLHESPISWYDSRKSWGLSPGYDSRPTTSFERPVGVECLHCHTGRTEPVGDTLNRVTFHEKAIGCESCHGPGSLHLERHRDGQATVKGDDLTIVNPGKLSRPLLESICGHCHLGGAALIHLRGRRVTDFRPGRPLNDYRITYRFAGDEGQMTVVGHMEQLRLSACYQKSPGLTCVTCHDPHRRDEPKDRVAFQRRMCLGCHADQACRLDVAERLKKEPADNCVTCHMPRGDTEVPHVAFTHHRIGRHLPRPPAALPEKAPDLVPTDGFSRLSELDRRHNLGLAYLEAGRGPLGLRFGEVYGERARRLLESVEEAGLREGVALQTLASLNLATREDRIWAVKYARQSLEAPVTSANLRAHALAIIALCAADEGRYDEAVAPLEEAVRLRRSGEDWRLLGVAYMKEGRLDRALPALRRSLEIQPFRPGAHAALAEAYDLLGDTRRAAEHREKAQWLLSRQQP